jgi:uncharacterized protein (TIGR00296 family)
MLLGAEEGRILVDLARKAIEEYLGKGIKLSPPADLPPSLLEKRGVFVTLKRYPSGDLRGCIGYPEPVFPLADAVIRSAISSAVDDPRFSPVRMEEMDRITVEVTVLTPPERIEAPPPELPSSIEIGRDGLIVHCRGAVGLLLPQVPVEWGWTPEEFLSHTCLKAGLPPGCWKDPSCIFYRFQGQIFTEVAPRGEVIEEKPGG